MDVKQPDIYSAFVIELLLEFKHQTFTLMDYDAHLLLLHAKALHEYETQLITQQLKVSYEPDGFKVDDSKVVLGKDIVQLVKSSIPGLGEALSEKLQESALLLQKL